LVSGKGRNFSPLHSINSNSGVHVASCAVGTTGSYPTVKAVKGVKLMEVNLFMLMKLLIVQIV